mmetsp:Transcript_18518/g.57874  ORF Transcript_18518/g.57874 Transcript_18518/m.57874 type:complete len:184 (-) Transcript_18518:1800-2351(-)
MKMKMIWITKFWKHDMYPSGLLGVNAVTVAHVRIEQHLNSTAARWQRRRNPRRVKSIRKMGPGPGSARGSLAPGLLSRLCLCLLSFYLGGCYLSRFCRSCSDDMDLGRPYSKRARDLHSLFYGGYLSLESRRLRVSPQMAHDDDFLKTQSSQGPRSPFHDSNRHNAPISFLLPEVQNCSLRAP